MVKSIGPFASGVRDEIVDLGTLPFTDYSFHQHPLNSAACAAESYQEEAVLQPHLHYTIEGMGMFPAAAPVRLPLRRVAAILSRVRSEMISRSNCRPIHIAPSKASVVVTLGQAGDHHH
jgi:hypothetical protein